MESLTIELHPTPPFDFELTAKQHTYFQGNGGADDFDGCVHRRLLDLGSRLALATVSSSGAVDCPELSLELRGDLLAEGDGKLAAGQIRWLLGMEQDLAPFYQLAESDSALAWLAKEFRGLHLPRAATLFEALLSAILGQQISAKVAHGMRVRLIQKYGVSIEFDGVAHYAFPSPEAILASSPEELRALKLTQRKAEYVYGIAEEAAKEGWAELYDLPDDQFVARLTALRGVGHWTAQWALVRGLARPDALPLGDLALRRGVSRLFLGGEPVSDAKVDRLAERWRPWRSYVTAYLFAAMRSGSI